MTDLTKLVSQMTLEEKAALCTGAGPWVTTAVERLGIPQMVVTDGPHGVRRTEDLDVIAAKSKPATCFPTASCLSASWDVELIAEMGEALAEECIALGVDVVLGPSNNMKRTPLCGRNFEYFSEDPYLSGELAAAYIQAVQGKGVGTSLKHFAVNNQEYQRFSIDSVLDERSLHEIYLPAFETAVKRAKPWTVMCAYNKVNGDYCSEHHELLSDILKNDWGFEGLVVSDWGAVHDRVTGLKAGLDLEMPGPKPRRVQAVIEAVEAGDLDEAVLDEAVRRVLSIVFKAQETPKGQSEFDRAAHHALTRKVASEGMVLLKNEGILPLQNPASIAVIGRSAKHPHYQGGGSSHINPTQVDSPFDELKKLAPSASFSYAEGYGEGLEHNLDLITEAVAEAQAAEVALIFVALPVVIESEGYDRKALDLTEQQVNLIKSVSAVQSNTVVILNNGSAVAMSEWLDGVPAVLESWMMGQAGGGAIADILFGRVNPSGKLAETFPKALQDTPAYLNYPGENGQVHYGEGLFIGYRYYDAKQLEVEFAFGHGLSYTEFEYSNLKLASKSIKDSDGLELSVDITNVGDVAGKETVQLYIHDQESKLVRPYKELKGFAKVSLEPGETKTVRFKLNFRSFAYYHPVHKRWVTEDGDFDILIGASATDIRLKDTVTLSSTLELPSILNKESTVKEWLEDKKGKEVFEPMFKEITASFTSAMGADTASEADIGMDMTGFLMDLPLMSLLDFQDASLAEAPETIVQGLLAKVRS
ncbi:MAG: glycoside hydrolase family 3 C-terminal domain-containing protein [Trueperaceae bacterium]|nr:glycoside hydrolase family 3 C-terminal domain-containing protein [Trueperaceae bacterium]